MNEPQGSDPRPDPVAEPGPGVAWLARRTGRRAAEFTGSPGAAATALAQAARQIAHLAARLESADPAVRASAQTELHGLRRDFAAAPSAGDAFRLRVADILRDIARR